MRTKWLFFTIIAVIISGIALAFLAIDTKEVSEVDIIAVNELVKTVESQWGQIEQGNYSSKIQQPFTIIDINGQVLYQSRSDLSATIYDAIKHRDTIVDVKLQNRGVGKVIIHNEDRGIVQHMKERLVTVLIYTFAVLAALCILYAAFIHHTVLKPFKKLQSFAVHVAKGNLDVPLGMDKNNLFGAFTESFDIMREELAAARRSEYESNRSKKELVASISHDIKTPVASIKAVSELMLLRAADDMAIKHVNTILSKADQINTLVTDMFHATLEELQELKVTVTEEPSSVLNGMIANVFYDHPIHCEPISECIILADGTRLQQVLDNVMSNSYKYAGTPVTIASRINHTHLELFIMDYGKGVSRDELPLVFNKFYRGNNVGGQSGSGLGLYISKYFMQNMQGDMECHNRADGFTVALKIKLA